MISVKQNVPLKNLSTIHTGGKAQYLATCKNEHDIIEALQHATSNSLPVTVLGGGSNSLISDEGVKGLVVKIELDGFSISSSGIATSGAGVSWDLFVAETCRQGMAGIEALSGIPGNVGATPIQNVGAYGQEVAETIKSLRAINRKSLETRLFSNEECQFSYRNSRFKEADKDEWIITEVTFQLDSKAEPKPRYEELQKSLLNDKRWNLSNREEKLLLVREHVLKIRAQKGMVLDPSDHDTVSLGSFFTNPLIDDNTKMAIQKRASELKAAAPVFHRAGENLWKISAAWLIENSGIKKGFTLGKARISKKHVLAITNPGEATTQDILQLQRHVETEVLKVFNVTLSREPVFLA